MKNKATGCICNITKHKRRTIRPMISQTAKPIRATELDNFFAKI